MKIIEIYQELTAQRVIQLANWISTVEQLYNAGQVTKTVAEYKKHPTENIWYILHDPLFNNMGNIGKQIMGFLLGSYHVTGNPVINQEVLLIKELTEEEYQNYLQNEEI
jgi:hypothetical protein